MKTYELGSEVFAVVPQKVDKSVIKTEADLTANTVIKTKIANRLETSNDPGSFVYEVEGHEGSVSAKKIFENIDVAKKFVVDNTKEGPLKDFIVKQMGSLTL